MLDRGAVHYCIAIERRAYLIESMIMHRAHCYDVLWMEEGEVLYSSPGGPTAAWGCQHPVL